MFELMSLPFCGLGRSTKTKRLINLHGAAHINHTVIATLEHSHSCIDDALLMKNTVELSILCGHGI
jgi:hypothetical protein